MSTLLQPSLPNPYEHTIIFEKSTVRKFEHPPCWRTPLSSKCPHCSNPLTADVFHVRPFVLNKVYRNLPLGRVRNPVEIRLMCSKLFIRKISTDLWFIGESNVHVQVSFCVDPKLRYCCRQLSAVSLSVPHSASVILNFWITEKIKFLVWFKTLRKMSIYCKLFIVC